MNPSFAPKLSPENGQSTTEHIIEYGGMTRPSASMKEKSEFLKREGRARIDTAHAHIVSISSTDDERAFEKPPHLPNRDLEKITTNPMAAFYVRTQVPKIKDKASK